MMKKLVLMLMLVLGMASLASAQMTVDISINGNPTPSQESGITLGASDYLTLDIDSISGFAPGDGEYFALVTTPALATISGGTCLVPMPSDVLGPTDHESESGMLYYVDTYGAEDTIAPGVYFNEILLHCEGSDLGQGTVINMYGTLDGQTWRVADSVTIHQVPEPVTIALLGLGGLFLRRRTKQQAA